MGKKPGWDSTIHDLNVYKLPASKLKEKLESRKPGHSIHSKSTRLFFVPHDDEELNAHSRQEREDKTERMDSTEWIERTNRKNKIDRTNRMDRASRIDDLDGEKRQKSKKNLRLHNKRGSILTRDYDSEFSSDNDSVPFSKLNIKKLNHKQKKTLKQKIQRAWDSENDSHNVDHYSEIQYDYNLSSEDEISRITMKNGKQTRKIRNTGMKSEDEVEEIEYHQQRPASLQSSNTLHWIEKMDQMRAHQRNSRLHSTNDQEEVTSHGEMKKFHSSKKDKIRALEEAYKSIHYEIDEFENSRYESLGDSDIESESQEGEFNSCENKDKSLLEEGISRKALEKWRQYESSQTEKRKEQSKSQTIITHEEYHNITSQLEKFSQDFNSLHRDLEIQKSINEQLKLEFNQYKQHTDTQIADLNQKLENMIVKYDKLSSFVDKFQSSFIIEKDYGVVQEAQNKSSMHYNTENSHQDISAQNDIHANPDSDEEAWNDSSNEDSTIVESSMQKDSTSNNKVQLEDNRRQQMDNHESNPNRSHQRSVQSSNHFVESSVYENQETRVIRSNVPSPSLSFNLMVKKPSFTSTAYIPETPQPNKSVPLPTSTQMDPSDIYNQEETMNHIVPSINRVSDPSPESLMSPSKQAKMTTRKTLQTCPTLSPRPSINRTNRIDVPPVMGRDREMLEPKISSQIGKFEVKKFVPTAMASR